MIIAQLIMKLERARQARVAAQVLWLHFAPVLFLFLTNQIARFRREATTLPSGLPADPQQLVGPLEA
jgi:hypothetical protein